MDAALLAFRKKHGIVQNSYEKNRKNSIDSGLDSSDSFEEDRKSQTQSEQEGFLDFEGKASKYEPTTSIFQPENLLHHQDIELEERPSGIFRKVNFYDEEQLPNADLISETSSDRRVTAYARSSKRQMARTSIAPKSLANDEDILFELALLMDKTRGLPCKTKKGKVSATNLFELDYRERKRQSLVDSISNEITPEKAFNLLNCKYLRLTEDNIKTLEMVCEAGGYDSSIHPHKEIDIERIFEDL